MRPPLASIDVVCGDLQVSNGGEILYVLPKNSKSILATRSLWVRTEPVVQGTLTAAAFAVRVVFGSMLVASVTLVWLTLLALMASASASSDDR